MANWNSTDIYLRLMQIKEATITIEGDGMDHLYEYPEMPVVDLIARLFEIYGAEIEIKLPEAKKIEFERIAIREWHTTNTAAPKEAYVKLWVDKETEKYFAIQRIHKAFNEYVMSSKTSVELTGRLKTIKDHILNNVHFVDLNLILEQCISDESEESHAPEFFPGVKEQLDDALKIRKDEKP